MTHYDRCPVCRSTNIEYFLTAKDHTVSGEMFRIWKCRDCSTAFTQDIPDENSIGRYYKSETYVSHSDTRSGFIHNLYHRVRQITLRQKLSLLKAASDLPAGVALDIGSGTGAFVNTLNKAGWQCTALEPDVDARAVAKSRYGIDARAPEELFKLPSDNYDAITAWHVMEHVHSLHEYLDEFKRILKQRGRIFIAVPNFKSYDAEYYRENWAAYDVPRHLYHFSASAMSRLVAMHGMKVLDTKCMWFDSYYVSMLSEKYKSSKSNLVPALLHATKSNMNAVADRKKCSSLIYIIGKD